MLTKVKAKLVSEKGRRSAETMEAKEMIAKAKRKAKERATEAKKKVKEESTKVRCQAMDAHN